MGRGTVIGATSHGLALARPSARRGLDRRVGRAAPRPWHTAMVVRRCRGSGHSVLVTSIGIARPHRRDRA